MSTIRNIWSEVKFNQNKDQITPRDILQEQANGINKDSDKTNLVGVVFSVSTGKNDSVEEVKHVLYLLPKNGKDYNYRFIEVVTKPDQDYPIHVNAYQNGNTDFGNCSTEDHFYAVLLKIFNDPRLKIVFEQLRNIGNMIEDWKTEL